MPPVTFWRGRTRGSVWLRCRWRSIQRGTYHVEAGGEGDDVEFPLFAVGDNALFGEAFDGRAMLRVPVSIVRNTMLNLEILTSSLIFTIATLSRSNTS